MTSTRISIPATAFDAVKAALEKEGLAIRGNIIDLHGALLERQPSSFSQSIMALNITPVKSPFSSTEQRVINVISECLWIPKADILRGAELTEDLGADSLDIVELVIALEDEFKVELSDDALENLMTVEDVFHLFK